MIPYYRRPLIQPLTLYLIHTIQYDRRQNCAPTYQIIKANLCHIPDTKRYHSLPTNQPYNSTMWYSCGSFSSQYLFEQRIPAILQPLDIFNGSEQYPALPLRFPLSTTTTPLRSSTRRHAKSRSSSGSEQPDKLGVTVPNGVSPFLLGHDMI